MKISKQGLWFLGSLFSIVLFFYLIFNSYPMQYFLGTWAAGLDPKRWEHVEGELQNKTDGELYKLLFHGDHIIRGAALQKLAKRKKVEWFDKYKGLLKSSRFEIRSAARGLMLSAAPDSVVYDALMKDIERYKPKDKDYLQIILMLVKRKYQPIYPYIVAYAEQGGWNSGAEGYFEELGDPQALPILHEMLSQVPAKGPMTRLARTEINKAIATLEAIKTKQQ